MRESEGRDAASVPPVHDALAAARKLSYLLAIVMAAQAVLGVLLPDQYRDVAWVRASWFGNDLVTLLVAVPMLLVTLAATRRGSVRGALVWLGVLAYALYNDAFYLHGAALNAFFPLYVLVFLVAAAALVRALSGLSPRATAAAFDAGRRTRFIGGYFVFVAAGLAVVWLSQWAAYVFAGRPTPIEPEAFKLVAALDLTVIVPALAIGGELLRRDAPWGFVVAPLAGVLGALYLLVLATNAAVAIALGQASWPGEVPAWAGLFVSIAVATAFLLAAARRR